MVSEKKNDFVQKLTEQLKSHPVIALVNMQSLPAPQLQTLRAQLLKKEIIIVMARKRLLQLALKNSAKENIDDLTKRIKGMPALLLSKENPFLLYSILQKNKSPAPAKANQIAPRDVVVPAGPTSFAPGPIISELASVGIKTKVDNGKLAILEDTVVVKEDEPISAKAAEMLKRLDIQPMEIGLDLIAAWEKGTVFEAKQLFIDEEEYSQNITRAFQDAFNLSLELALPTADNIEQLLQKAFRDSKNVAIEQSIINSETRDEILAKTERQALSVKEAAGNLEVSPAPVEKPKAEALKEEPAAEKPEEKPAEEKKAEKPAEPEAKKEAPVAEKPAEKEATPAQEEKDEPQAEKPVEEPQEEKESETPAPEPAAEPAEEKQAVEEPVAGPPEPEPEPEPTPEPTPEPEPQPEPVPPQPEPLVKEAAIPTAAEMIAETKKQYAEKQPEVKEQVSAEQLVAEELAKPKQPKQNEDVKEAENLFEKLKKEGTLRQEE